MNFEESHGHHASIPLSFHKALSIRNIQVNSSKDYSQSQGTDSEEKHEPRVSDDNSGVSDFVDDSTVDDDDDDNDNEFNSLLASPHPVPPPLPLRTKFQPLSITTPQQDEDYAIRRTNAFSIRIPSVRLPPIRGSLYDRYHRKRRLYAWCECCCDNHHCCACCGSFGWVTCCCRLLMVVIVLGGIFFVATPLVWEESTLSSSQKKPKPGGSSSSIVEVADDDIVYFASAASASSRIRGDYSTVQNMDDLMVLASNVPILCYDSTVTTSRNNRRKKNAHSIQDCPCAVLDSDDAVNSRTTPMQGSLPGWDETFQRNARLANLNEPLFYDTNHTATNNETDSSTISPSTEISPPNVVFLGDSIIERWYGTRLGKVEDADMAENQAVFVDLFRGGGDSNGTLTVNDTQSIQALPLGIAGDQTPNVLWRLENGELPDVLQPMVFVLLIGTNDLSRDWCSDENVVVGIVRIVELLLQKRPTATILLHGLLPRTFDEAGYLDKGRTVGEGIRYWGNYFNHGGDDVGEELPNFWPDIQVINDELRGELTSRWKLEFASSKEHRC
jgi:lysophospholipase L1-like esterase